MEYYKICESCNVKVIGSIFPQVDNVMMPTQWDDQNYIHAYLFKKAPPSVLLPKVILHKKAKITDLISSSSTFGLAHNLLISNQLKEVIEVSNTHSTQFFAVKVNHCDKEYNYWLLHTYDFYFDQIDFQKSLIAYYRSFTSTDEMIRRSKAMNVTAFREELISYEKKIVDGTHNFEGLQISELYFNGAYNKDFFTIKCVANGVGFYVSEKLKIEIESIGCTGLEFVLPHEVYL